MPKRKTTKRTATKRKASKRKPTQRKPTKRKATTRRATKRKVTERGATKRTATKRTTTKRTTTKRKAIKRRPTRRSRSRTVVAKNLTVFISWSGDRSKCLANRLRQILPTIVPNIDVTISTSFVGGNIWLKQLTEAVEKTDFAILCVTADNLGSIWMNYEAGALWQTRREPHVCPLTLDELSEDQLSRSPILLSQAKRFEVSEFEEVCKLLADKTEMDTVRFANNFKTLWPTLNDSVKDDLKELEKRRSR